MASNDGWEDVPVDAQHGWEDVPLKPATSAPPQIGAAEAFGQGYLNGIPLARPLSNALATAGYLVGRRGPGVKLGRAALEAGAKQEEAPGLVDAYRNTRDYLAARDAAGAEQQGLAHGAGTVTGIGASLLAPGPKILGNATSAPGRVLSNALTAGTYGTLNALTNGKADLTRGEVGQAAKDVLGVDAFKKAADDYNSGHVLRAALDVGGAGAPGAALTGGVLGAGLEAVRGPLGGAAERFANLRAVKAVGAIQKDLKKLPPEKVQAIGKTLLEKGVLKPWSSKEAMYDAISEHLAAAGGRMDDALATADAANPLGIDTTRFKDAARRIEDEAGGNPIRAKAARDAYAAADLDSLGQKGPVDFKTAHQLESDFSKNLYGKVEAPVRIKGARQVGHALDQELERQIGEHAGEDALSQFQQAKAEYGPLAEASRFAKEGADRQHGNHFLSLYDVMAAGGEFAHSHDPIKSAAVAVMAKLLREKGAQNAALAGNAVSKALTAPVAGRLGLGTEMVMGALQPRAALSLQPQPLFADDSPLAGQLAQAQALRRKNVGNFNLEDGTP